MSDDLAAALTNDAPAPEAPAPAPITGPAAEESRRSTIREAVEAQKEKAAPSEGRNPNAPPKVAPAAAERARAPDGKFSPAVDRPLPSGKLAVVLQGVADQRHQAAASSDSRAEDAANPADAPAVGVPPGGWSPASKVAFDSLPDCVKADIAKREREVDAGFAKLAEYKPVDKYLDMAKRGGTTLEKALEQYTGIEELLRRDVFAGFEQIAKNTGINLRSFATAYLQRGGHQTGPQGAPPAAHQTAPIDPQAIVRQAQDAVREEFAQKERISEIERFAADPKNRFFANVEPVVLKLLQSGLVNGQTAREKLQNAYDMACRMDPEISRLINAPPPLDPRRLAADQARAAAKAVNGAPPSGLTSAAPVLNAKTTRDAVRAAVAQQRDARA